jgi:hypothetical protein
MTPNGRALLTFGANVFRSHLSLQLEIGALRHQRTLYQRSIRRLQVRLTDHLVWSWLS